MFNLLSPYWFSVHLFYVGNRKAEISSYNFGFIFSLVISISFHFMYFEALLLGTHLFRIVMLSWWINPFIIMLHLLVILVIFLVLKSTLFDINIVTLAFSWLTFTWYVLFCPFTFNLPKSSYLKWISCKKHLVWILLFYTTQQFLSLIDVFSHLHLMQLLIYLDLTLSFWYFLKFAPYVVSSFLFLPAFRLKNFIQFYL